MRIGIDPGGTKIQVIALAPSVKTRLLPPGHGDSSGVRGAAWLWPAQD